MRPTYNAAMEIQRHARGKQGRVKAKLYMDKVKEKRRYMAKSLGFWKNKSMMKNFRRLKMVMMCKRIQRCWRRRQEYDQAVLIMNGLRRRRNRVRRLMRRALSGIAVKCLQAWSTYTEKMWILRDKLTLKIQCWWRRMLAKFELTAQRMKKNELIKMAGLLHGCQGKYWIRLCFLSWKFVKSKLTEEKNVVKVRRQFGYYFKSLLENSKNKIYIDFLFIQVVELKAAMIIERNARSYICKLVVRELLIKRRRLKLIMLKVFGNFELKRMSICFTRWWKRKREVRAAAQIQCAARIYSRRVRLSQWKARKDDLDRRKYVLLVQIMQGRAGRMVASYFDHWCKHVDENNASKVIGLQAKRRLSMMRSRQYAAAAFTYGTTYHISLSHCFISFQIKV
jgi:hypothetical protein